LITVKNLTVKILIFGHPISKNFVFLIKKGTNEIHEKLFKKMDAIRDKQEKIAKKHFEQDTRLTESK